MIALEWNASSLLYYNAGKISSGSEYFLLTWAYRLVTTLWRVGADMESNCLSNEMSLERGVTHELKQRNKCIGPLKYYSLQPLEVAVTPTHAIEME